MIIRFPNQESGKERYKLAQEDFLAELEQTISSEGKVMYKLPSRQGEVLGGNKNEFIKNPSVYLKNFFEREEFFVSQPIDINNDGGTTFLTNAAIQIFERSLTREEPVPGENMFLAQPVIRSQFRDKISEGISTSFVNIATECANLGPQKHFENLKIWARFLEEVGIDIEQLEFFIKESSPEWGDVSFENSVIKVHYKGISIGDAVFIYGFPQKNRSSIPISDIGFGLERLQWLIDGGNYYDQFGKQFEEFRDLSMFILDHCRTLALLSGSGVRPSQKDAGFRFRTFSKALMKIPSSIDVDLVPLIHFFYNEWKQWIDLSVPVEQAIQIIKMENQRNFNMILMNKLKKFHKDVGIDVNMPTRQFLLALRGTSVTRQEIELLLDQLRYHGES